MCVYAVVCSCCVFTLNAAFSSVIFIICLAALKSASWLTLHLNSACVCVSVFSLYLWLAISLYASQTANRLASPSDLHQITLYCVYIVCVRVLAGCSCFRLSVSSWQQGDCRSLQRHSKERREEERDGKRGEVDQASSGHHSRENDEVKGDVSLVPDLWTVAHVSRVCQRFQKDLVLLIPVTVLLCQSDTEGHCEQS